MIIAQNTSSNLQYFALSAEVIAMCIWWLIFLNRTIFNNLPI